MSIGAAIGLLRSIKEVERGRPVQRERSVFDQTGSRIIWILLAAISACFHVNSKNGNVGQFLFAPAGNSRKSGNADRRVAVEDHPHA